MNASPYAIRVLNRLGDRDPLATLGATAAELRRVCDGVSEDALRRPEADGKWSMLDVVHHLADAEMVIGVRIRMILADDRPAIAAYDQDAWATKFQYRGAELPPLLQRFETLREANLRLARQLTSDDLQRVGMHSERGPESVEYTLRLTAGHDLVHLDQLERVRRAALG